MCRNSFLVVMMKKTNPFFTNRYTVKSNGDRIFNTGETWGATTEELKHFPQQYRTLCLSYLEKARAECDALPELNPNIVLMNNYTPDNAGIYWHRDNSTADRYAFFFLKSFRMSRNKNNKKQI